MKTEDFYRDMKEDLAEFLDLSNFPKDHELFSDKNKAIPGLFKDETAGYYIKEFILRASPLPPAPLSAACWLAGLLA